MTVEFLAALLLLGLGASLIVLILAIACGNDENCHERKTAHVHQTHQETMQLLDKTADYYVRLYRYIDRRLDDESRRRQSG